MRFIVFSIKTTLLLFILGMILISLSACTKQTDAISDINNELQQGVFELIDYANNNMSDDPDTRLLKTGLKDCAAKANAMTENHKANIKACEAQTSKAKAERNTLALVLILLVAVKLFNIRL